MSADFTGKKIVVLSPVMYPDARFFKCLVNAVACSWHYGLRVEEMGITEREVVDWARNNLARAAREKMSDYDGKPFTHFLFLDCDHTFNADLILRLMAWDVDMVGALYYGRKEPYLPCVYVKDHTEDPYKYFPLLEVPSMLFECDAIGFGAILIKREVFDRVPEPWFTVDYRAGEDIAFCTHARQNGIKIHCDGGLKLGHVGDAPIIKEETFNKFMAEHKEDFGDRVKIALNGGR